ncbi:hypothetical protein FH972_022237 [Carpinus fangiana]|uniref:Uncharacterized protein n=1 Tax=Carpinus fangiana TaxID=176857 RepID=A0A5N6KSA4_9ROSI|nr:hypothetical protein FH972_022237 [Carpinus fangiana]
MSDPMASPLDDLFAQAIPILLPDGTTMTITPVDIDAYTNYGIRICINYASQIGASFVLLATLALVTRADRRTSAVFALNMASLLLNGIRNILQCLYFSGPFYTFYAQFAGDFSRVPPSQFGASIAGIVLTWLLLASIEASLVLQVRAVCVTLPRAQRTTVLLLCAFVALLALAFRFALVVTNARAVVALAAFDGYYWLAATNNYVTMASVCLFSGVFVGKLGVALVQRRRLGLRQFGPLQILFVMGCQTLVVPAVFAVLQACTDVPELGSQMLTVVALFLPLSSMWASAALGQPGVLAEARGGAGVEEGKGRGSYQTGSTVSSNMSDGADAEKKSFLDGIKDTVAGHRGAAGHGHGFESGKTKTTPGNNFDLQLDGTSTVTKASTSPLTPIRQKKVQDLERNEVRVDTFVGITNEPRMGKD